jgi:hypothetical protein
MWQSKFASAAVLSALSVVILLLRWWPTWNILSLTSFVACAYFVLLFVVQFISGPAFGRLQSSVEARRPTIELGDLSRAIEKSITEWVYLFRTVHPIALAAVFYVLFKITSWLAPSTLFLFLVISAFVVPTLYHSRKAQIDAVLGHYKELAMNLWTSVRQVLLDLVSKIPRAVPSGQVQSGASQ